MSFHYYCVTCADNIKRDLENMQVHLSVKHKMDPLTSVFHTTEGNIAECNSLLIKTEVDEEQYKSKDIEELVHNLASIDGGGSVLFEIEAPKYIMQFILDLSEQRSKQT